MNDIKYFDNLLPQGYADQIEADLMSREFPWHYINDVTNESYGNNAGFVHVIYEHEGIASSWYPFIKPLVYSIAEANGKPLKHLYRIRVGCLLPSNRIGSNSPHLDLLWPHYTACYYVNNSDGNTVLFDQTKENVGPVLNDITLRNYTDETQFTIAGESVPHKNSVCLFDGFRFHASTNPKQTDRRLVITVNYI